MGTPLYILSFSDADSIRYFSRASSNDYKKGNYKIDIKVREKSPQFSLSRAQHEAALKGL